MGDFQPDHLDAYMNLGAQDIARLVLCLLIEEALEGRLAAFRHGLELRDRGAPRRTSGRLPGNKDDLPVFLEPELR